MAKPALNEPRAAHEIPATIGPALENMIATQVKAALDLHLAELKRTTPRQVFNGDDALFLSWMSGFVAGVHVCGRDSDPHALEIFKRCQSLAQKLSPAEVPSANAS